MVKKLKVAVQADTTAEITLLTRVEDSARTLWLTGSSVYSTVQNVRSEVVYRVAHEVKAIRNGARQRVSHVVSSIEHRVSNTRHRIERRVEEAISVPLDMLGIPTRKDVDKLARRVAELNAAVKRLALEKAGKPAVRPAG